MTRFRKEETGSRDVGAVSAESVPSSQEGKDFRRQPSLPSNTHTHTYTHSQLQLMRIDQKELEDQP